LIIERLQIHNFGCLDEGEFEFASGLNIIRGPNEAGKSTLQAALLTVLFHRADKPKQAVQRWQSWGTEDLFELALEFTAVGHQWRLKKDFAGKEVCLVDLDSGAEWTNHSKAQDKIAQLLGTGSQDIYESTAAIRQQQISALGAGGELSELLQRSVSGAASGVSVSQIIGQLDKALTELRRGLKRPAPVNPGPLYLVAQEIASLEEELSRLQEEEQKISQAWQKLRATDEQIAQLKPQIEEAEQFLEKVDRRRRLEEQRAGFESEWFRLYQDIERVEQLSGEIAELKERMGELPEVSAEEADKARSLTATIARAEADIASYQQRLDEIHKQQQDVAAESKEVIGEESSRQLLDQAVSLQDEQRAIQMRIGQFERELQDIGQDLANRVARRRNRRIRIALGALLALGGGVCAVLYSSWGLLVTLIGIVLAAMELFGTRPQGVTELLARREKGESDLREAYNQRQLVDEQLQELLAEAGVDSVAGLSTLLSDFNERQSKLTAALETTEEALKRRRRELAEAKAALDQLLSGRFSSADELLRVHQQRQQLQGEIEKKQERRQGILGTQELTEMKQRLDKLALERATVQQQLDSPELAHIALDTLDIERLRNELECNKEALEVVTKGHQEARFVVEHSDFDPEQQLRTQEKLQAARQRQQRLLQKEQVYELTRSVLAEAYQETLSQTQALVEPRLAELLAVMTGGRYNQVRLAIDEFVPRVVSPDKGEEAEAGELSWATREQLYLAARLALTRVLWPEEGPPLLLDDPLVNFDERRYAATMKLLANFGQHRQILFFTCSADFDDYADHIVKLLGPA